MKPIITVEGVSKRYTIGKKESYGSLRDEVMDALSSPFRRVFGGGGKVEDPSVWALKDVSFEVQEGDVLGIIGRNGAGKSTLLKILSRIVEPTEGRIEMRGRMASLLEVGTGFHPELTGRENIFMNGALLGMTSAEIRAKFDEIVAFSEIEKFLDTPVKRYSSGMYVRLAFAVAAHLEPEILVIDEVLAVGDAAFQKKCLGKMGEVAKGGRTVLFVSHNMAAIESLCTKGVVLTSGTKVFEGLSCASVKFYMNLMIHESYCDLENIAGRKGEGNLRISKIEIEDDKCVKSKNFPIGSKLRFLIKYKAKSRIQNPRVIIGVYNLMQEGIARFDTNITGGLFSTLPESGVLACKTDTMNLTPGRYFINIAIFSGAELQDYLTHAYFIDIEATDYFGTGRAFDVNDERLTKVLIRHEWDLVRDAKD